MSIDFRQETTAGTGQLAQSARVSSLAISKGGHGSGGNSPTLQTTGGLKTGVFDSGTARRKAERNKVIKIQPRIRQRCRRLFSACLESLEIAIDNPGEFFVRNNAIEQLKESMEELWALGDAREEPFAEAINILQGMLLEKSAEDFDDKEISALKGALLRLHGESVVDENIVTEIVFSLVEDGIDVFRPIK